MTTRWMVLEQEVAIHQLSSLDEWEFYRIVPFALENAPLTISLRPHAELGQVEYEIWDEQAKEPRITQSWPCAGVGERWSTFAREFVLLEILESESPWCAKSDG